MGGVEDANILGKQNEEMQNLLTEVKNQMKDLTGQFINKYKLQLISENATLKKEIENLKQSLSKYEINISNEEKASMNESGNKSEKKVLKEPPSKPIDKKTKNASAADSASSKSASKSSTSGGSNDSEPDLDVRRLDFRIGKILSAEKHPDADSLYVEKIDVGEENARTVVSGLVKHISAEELQGRLVVVLCNLKPAKMRGIVSEAMVMCASTPDKVEVLSPPSNSIPGDLVSFEGYPRVPDPILNPKKKVFELLAPDLTTNHEKVATYKGVPFYVQDKGKVVTQSLANVQVK